MKLITREIDYAVRALCRIAERGSERPVTAEDIVGDLAIPRPFLRKILRLLASKGLLRSVRGMGGGFKLAWPLGEMRLIDVITAFQDGFNMNECLFRKKICPQRRTCVLRHKIEEIEAGVRRELAAVTIASLCGGTHSGSRRR